MQLPGFLSRLSLPRWPYVVGAAVVVVAGGYFYFGSGDSVGATFTVTKGDFPQEVSVSGTVIASKAVDLGFAANGRIIGTYASVGQHVNAGAVLAEVENGDLRAALAQKQAALAQAQANLASLQAGTRPEELAVAQASVASAQSALLSAVQSAFTAADDAVHNKADAMFTNPRYAPKLSFTVANANLKNQVENERTALESVLTAWAASASSATTATAADKATEAQADLSQVSAFLTDLNAALTQAQPDQTTSSATLATYSSSLAGARTSLNTAATALADARAALVSAEKNLALKQAGSTPDAIAAQEAAVAVAEADVENARAALAKTLVAAPFAGTVTRMDAKAGEIVSPATSEISMQSDGVFEIETYIPEISIANVAAGNPATTTLDAYGSGVTFPSKVVAVDPAETVKEGVPTYKTTLAFLMEDPRIRSGMTANVVITTGMLRDAIVIPAGAVAHDASGAHVSVLVDKKVENRAVESGATPSLGQVQIVSGLTPGDVILLTPQ